jgi:hypothetical protein
MMLRYVQTFLALEFAPHKRNHQLASATRPLTDTKNTPSRLNFNEFFPPLRPASPSLTKNREALVNPHMRT